MIMSETVLKGQILTRGVSFSDNALKYASVQGAKCQNMVYNAPVGSNISRPQELIIRHFDGYETVVSCVAPCKENEVQIDLIDQRLVAFVDGRYIQDIDIDFVKQPDYYSTKIGDGSRVKSFVSACGYDELNILPWSGCSVSKGCLFCGINTVMSETSQNCYTADRISQTNLWKESKEKYVDRLKQAILIASKSECYNEHMHVIMISGNLSNNQLDLQAEIYSYIASHIREVVAQKATEGIIAVLMPPNKRSLIPEMLDSGISTVVFNLEVGDRKLFEKYCPGKADIGYDHILESLYYASEVFGRGHSWSNFVLGLEPMDGLLKINEKLAMNGVVSSANVLHLDKGNRLDCTSPDFDDVIRYFYELSGILKQYDFKPFYCEKALRTSLSNEAFNGRIKF